MWAMISAFSPVGAPGEQLPPPDANERLEKAVSGGRPAVRVGPVVDPPEPLQLAGVVLGRVGRVGHDQGVVGDQGGRPVEEFGGDRGGVPVRAPEVPAELLLGGVDVGLAPVGGAGDGGQVDVPAGHQPGDHVGEELPPAGVGEWLGETGGEGGQSRPDRCGERGARHGSRLLPWLRHQGEEAFSFPGSTPTHTG